MIRRTPVTRAVTVALALATIVSVSGCSNDPLAEAYRDGTTENYISGNGVYEEIAPAERGAAVDFEGVSDTGEPIASNDYAGDVYVVNFWYAGCPPCRAEAPDLEALAQEYADGGVSFLGVNVYDQADTARAFARTYSLSYPSIVDANDVRVQLAFASTVAPNAVPTTLVMDREGRVAARYSGQIEKSILAAMIDRVLGES